MLTKIKTPQEIEYMRFSGNVLGTVLAELELYIKPGMTTWEVARRAEKIAYQFDVQLPFKGYQGFPDVICISVDNEIVHGIPSKNKMIEDGSLVGLDFGIQYKGMITDAAITVGVGCVDEVHKALLSTTKNALLKGCGSVKSGVMTGDIGSVIESYVRSQGRYGIVRDLVGHGVGHELHESPDIPNYGKKGSGYELKSGMTVALEPMLTMGTEQIGVLEDGWTIVTRDGLFGAQFEHTVLITDDGAEILTLPS